MTQHGAYSAREAHSYDSDREIEPLWHAENAYVAALLQRTPARSILDVPVGTGRFLALYGTREVLGIDLSPEMLKEAAAKIVDLGDPPVRLLEASATSLPVGDRGFDLIVCWRLLHLLPPESLRAVFVELHRTCRGKLCVQFYVRAPWFERVRAKAWRWWRRARLLFHSDRTLTPWSHIRAYSHSRSTIEQAARAAGLTAPDRVEELGAYEGTRVVAMEWNVAQ